jgi:hypothetical protein
MLWDRWARLHAVHCKPVQEFIKNSILPREGIFRLLNYHQGIVWLGYSTSFFSLCSFSVRHVWHHTTLAHKICDGDELGSYNCETSKNMELYIFLFQYCCWLWQTSLSGKLEYSVHDLNYRWWLYIHYMVVNMQYHFPLRNKLTSNKGKYIIMRKKENIVSYSTWRFFLYIFLKIMSRFVYLHIQLLG